ncbi:hypothetical protein Bca4012_002194 [Brassica carinata]|uniref:Uncharacterized protein n=1 Tax=Brassica oleracea TaxID=3712 RepID=A0A3P6AK95_BRAOL|nr:unnamed protein product [Brassica oleracea]
MLQIISIVILPTNPVIRIMKGFHELPGLDNTATCIVSKEDLAVSDINCLLKLGRFAMIQLALEDEELMMESVSSSNLMFQSKDSLSLSVQSLTLEVAEPSSEVARHALINGDNDGNKIRYTAIDKNCMVDHSPNLVKLRHVSSSAFDSQSGQVPLADNDVETNSEDNLDDETDCITVTNAVAGVDSRSKLNF